MIECYIPKNLMYFNVSLIVLNPKIVPDVRASDAISIHAKDQSSRRRWHHDRTRTISIATLSFCSDERDRLVIDFRIGNTSYTKRTKTEKKNDIN